MTLNLISVVITVLVTLDKVYVCFFDKNEPADRLAGSDGWKVGLTSDDDYFFPFHIICACDNKLSAFSHTVMLFSFSVSHEVKLLSI